MLWNGRLKSRHEYNILSSFVLLIRIGITKDKKRSPANFFAGPSGWGLSGLPGWGQFDLLKPTPPNINVHFHEQTCPSHTSKYLSNLESVYFWDSGHRNDTSRFTCWQFFGTLRSCFRSALWGNYFAAIILVQLGTKFVKKAYLAWVAWVSLLFALHYLRSFALRCVAAIFR